MVEGWDVPGSIVDIEGRLDRDGGVEVGRIIMSLELVDRLLVHELLPSYIKTKVIKSLIDKSTPYMR